ncbi:cation:proton antiporter [Micromonospora eburnea]|uniref:Kef-type K+ transport system, membrane component KefB n=1 Tax=Micromonospora eburnea TaxID=227316 RepID=A0A1C6UZ55_9ACTN|nr:cation:proton antiporter [Micromonospora eburnea]SCL59316.1 Kef-type K+ transport system, membrane component KefB [Micromonospora eburnea]
MANHQGVVLLLDLALILLISHTLGGLARRIGQPAVIGEVIGGILLGPTLFHGVVTDTLFPLDVRPYLTTLATLGVTIFMFTVGLDLDARRLRETRDVVGAVSFGSVALPLVLGIGLAVLISGSRSGSDRLGFVLFLGAAMSVTAFPVLARILTDRGLSQSRLGNVTLAAAAINDVLAWLLLAAIMVIVGASGTHWLTLLVLPYLVLMFGALRPAFRRLLSDRGGTTAGAGRLALVLAGLLASSAFTEWVGLHFIFGAFVFGLVIPREGADNVRRQVLEPLGFAGRALLLPVFFLVAGLNVDLSRLNGADAGLLALIVVTAVGGKFVGAYLGAHATGVDRRPAAVLGILMNTRGLTELVMLNAGLQLGVLQPDLYSLMVVMAVVTTAMAGPLLRLLAPEQDGEPALLRTEALHSARPAAAASGSRSTS